MTQRTRAAMVAILLLHFALVIQYGLRVPLGEAPDEADHWAYVVYIVQNKALPPGPEYTQAKHPPLFHLGAALFAALGEPSAEFFHPNPAVNLTPGAEYSPNFFQHTAEQPPWSGPILAYHLARLWSALLTTATVAASYALGRAAWRGLPWLAVLAAALVGFLPEFLFLGGALSNDTAAALCGALALWGALALYRSDGDLRSAWWTPLALGAGMLAKASSVALWPVAGLGLLLGVFANRSQDRTAWTRLVRVAAVRAALLFAPALLLVLPWMLRNLRLYGDLMGMAMARKTVDLRTTPWSWSDSQWLLKGWFFSFWGKFGGAGHIPMATWSYLLAGGMMAVAAAGLLWWWVRSHGVAGWREVRLPLLLLAAGPVGVALSMWSYSLIALGTDQGRLLFPALAAIMVLLAGGLLVWLPRAFHAFATLLCAAAMLLMAVHALWGVIVPTFVGL